ncbi:hypothetical protein K437DRAFT_19493 [Tilletiaria anomala UBC 951]|uniref:RRM domain-containing protein n=1 Tax=Tilletiaria anomala (strain ATCC 24038 / CBS 436.72 / UBC 951) TaxID=1037660 RepID=A0A066VB37_TILAU|nr:uncharacterized protein K437DRAFT_19493 [Tilletiaria anomala UBC 951]KDN38947.1 hypothetical protein K437DRAFT_19493 [Tilletiaria anomala UBC 951]
MPRLEYSRKSPEMLHVSGLGNVSKREFESPAHFDEEVATFFGGPSCVRSVRGLWEFKASPRLKGIYFDFDSPQTAREVCARGNGLEFEGQRLRLEFKGTGPTAAPNPGLLGGSVAAPGLGGRQSFRKIRFDAPQKVVNLRFISPPDGGEFDVRDLSPFNTAAEPDGRYHVSKLVSSARRSRGEHSAC